MTRWYAHMGSPVGTLLLTATERGLRSLDFVRQKGSLEVDPAWIPSEKALAPALAQVAEHFAGTRRRFELDLDLVGTPFQIEVWEALREIPWGETISYGELARRVGRPGGARAVGGANGRNPLPVVVPCHRVIAADGGLGGFSSGLPVKRALLRFEGIVFG